jgi:hypothetical protein
MATETDDWVITFRFETDPSMTAMDRWEDQLAGCDGSVARIPGQGVDVTVYAPGALEMSDAIGKMKSRTCCRYGPRLAWKWCAKQSGSAAQRHRRCPS